LLALTITEISKYLIHEIIYSVTIN